MELKKKRDQGRFTELVKLSGRHFQANYLHYDSPNQYCPITAFSSSPALLLPHCPLIAHLYCPSLNSLSATTCIVFSLLHSQPPPALPLGQYTLNSHFHCSSLIVLSSLSCTGPLSLHCHLSLSPDYCRPLPLGLLFSLSCM